MTTLFAFVEQMASALQISTPARTLSSALDYVIRGAVHRSADDIVECGRQSQSVALDNVDADAKAGDYVEAEKWQNGLLNIMKAGHL
jgi:hypothetical protein